MYGFQPSHLSLLCMPSCTSCGGYGGRHSLLALLLKVLEKTPNPIPRTCMPRLGNQKNDLPSPPALGLNSSKYLSMGTASRMSET